MTESQTPVYQVENIVQYTKVQQSGNVVYVNRQLDEGWKLLGIFPTSDGHTSEVTYVLGTKD